MKPRLAFLWFLGALALFLFGLPSAHAATLSLSPPSGTFEVGSTFNVNILLDTEGQSVNTLDVSLSFPPDKLQVTTPSVGNSIVGVWTAQPKLNNLDGTVTFQGGMPGGITVSKGLVSTVTFRVKSVGSAFVKFLDSSRVLLNDGKGTDVLSNTSNGIFQFKLPPPGGPNVVSETHPDESEWYADRNVVLAWNADSDVQAVSYVLNDEPVDIPDDIADSARNSVTYRAVADGIHYFHIKALRAGIWGGTTHFSVHVDASPPADFPVEVAPGTRTVRRQPIFQFSTTDAYAGLDHYELKIVPLSGGTPASRGDEPIFVEAQSPYLSPVLDLGTYDVIVRAYDKARNFREVVTRVAVVPQLLEFVADKGLSIKNQFVIPWNVVWGLAALLLLVLGFMGWRIERWHKKVERQHAERALPTELTAQLNELTKYREKYGKVIVLCLLLLGSIFGGVTAHAASLMSPPLITTVSRNISNDEIFYVGGKTEDPETSITLYLQSTETGQITSAHITSDKRSEWFYQHTTFLPVGNYLVWAQAQTGEEQSPPSPQVQFSVERSAFQWGATRVSFESLNFVIIAILALVLLALIVLIVFHYASGKRKHAVFMRHVKEAEESIRRGFAVLRRDIESELQVLKTVKMSKELTREEKLHEEQLLRDLALVERYIGKEIWEMERAESQASH